MTGKIPLRHAVAGLLLCLSTIIANAAQPLTMTAPPRETAEAGRALYKPLADYLSTILNTNVIYRHPDNWMQYQSDMRTGKYDIVFDGPHFISWRIRHLNHSALLRLPGTLEFFLVVASDDDQIQQPEDLYAKRICGISPPNLSTLSVLDRYPNPVRQPRLQPVNGGMGKVFKEFQQGRCRAAVLRTTFYHKKLSDADRARVKIIMRSVPRANQGISVGPRIDARQHARIRRALTSAEGIQVTDAIVKRFGGKKARAFVLAANQEYSGDSKLLEGVILGW